MLPTNASPLSSLLLSSGLFRSYLFKACDPILCPPGRLMARQQVALECLSYHATASQEDTDKLCKALVPNATHFDLYK